MLAIAKMADGADFNITLYKSFGIIHSKVSPMYIIVDLRFFRSLPRVIWNIEGNQISLSLPSWFLL